MAALYASQGRGIAFSQHTKRLAVDLNVFTNGKYRRDCAPHKELGEYWEMLDHRNRWGGRFNRDDCNHYEMRG